VNMLSSGGASCVVERPPTPELGSIQCDELNHTTYKYQWRHMYHLYIRVRETARTDIHSMQSRGACPIHRLLQPSAWEIIQVDRCGEAKCAIIYFRLNGLSSRRRRAIPSNLGRIRHMSRL